MYLITALLNSNLSPLDQTPALIYNHMVILFIKKKKKEFSGIVSEKKTRYFLKSVLKILIDN